MEVIALGPQSIKIKGKNATFVVNPSGKVDSEVVILTQRADSYSQYGDNLVIDGPGDYEVSGVSIKGEATNGKVSYTFLEENQGFLLLASNAAAKDKEAEDLAATILMMDDKADNVLSTLASQLVIVCGSDEFLPSEKETLKKADKINLKKIEDYKGFVVHLSK